MKNFILKVENNNAQVALNSFLQGLLKTGAINALMVQQSIKGAAAVQTFITDPEAMTDANPYAPISLQNAAKLVSDLTFKGLDQKVGVVLRSCEVRALVELVKLKQAIKDNLVIIGIDCLGTFVPSDFRSLVEEGKLNPTEWAVKASNGQTKIDNVDVRNACQVCDHIVAEHAQIHIGWVGMDVNKELLIEVEDDLVNKLKDLGLSEASEQTKRKELIAKLVTERANAKEKRFADFASKVNNMDSLAETLSTCLKCGNCRQACPICFCRECVFLSPIYQYDADKYFAMASRKGKIEMPTDTLLFHLTRANHMGESCVGCGQCEEACPSNLPISTIFQVLGKKIQDIFEYVPGRSYEEELPLTTFKEVELEPR